MNNLTLYKHKLINKIISWSPAWLITLKHELNHKDNPSLWIDDNYLFLHIPKSGGTSVAIALNRKESGHFKFSSLIKKHPEINNKKAYFFIARDPIERIISTYTYIKDLHRKFGTSNIPEIDLSDSLDSYIKNNLNVTNVNEHYFLRPFSEVIKGVPKSRLYAINFDRLSSNMSEFYDNIIGENIEMPHSNKSTTRSDLYISEESKRIIQDKYNKDFVIYNKVKSSSYMRL